MRKLALLCAIPTVLAAILSGSTPLAAQQKKLEVQERPGNTILMDDSFEYAIIDYGLGQVQVRSLGSNNDLTERFFWVKFRITNRAEHLIQTPRHFPSVLDGLHVTDNWGNAHWLRSPSASDVGGNWHGATIPVPEGERKDRYKPGESSWALRIIPEGEFVEGASELLIFLAN